MTQCSLAHVPCARLKLNPNCALRRRNFKYEGAAPQFRLRRHGFSVGGPWAPQSARSRGPIHVGIATQRAQRVGAAGGATQGNANSTHANRNPLQSRPSRANVGIRRRRVSPSMRGRLRLRQHCSPRRPVRCSTPLSRSVPNPTSRVGVFSQAAITA